MHKPRLLHLAAVLAIAGALAGTVSHAQQFPQTLPPNTVVGRLGAGAPGRAQAIPFASLASQLTPFLSGIGQTGPSGSLLFGQGLGIIPLWIVPIGDITTSFSGQMTINSVKGIPFPNSFTANAPILGNGTAVLGSGTVSGNTTIFATSNGALTNGDCVSIDASGNFVDAGGACTTGGGGGTVTSGTAGQFAYYATSAATVSSNSNLFWDSTHSTLTNGGAAVATDFGAFPSIEFNVLGTVGQAIQSWSTSSSGGPALYFERSRGTSVGTHVAVTNSDQLVYQDFGGSDGTAFATGAYIAAHVDGTVAAGKVPGSLDFATNPVGQTFPSVRLHIAGSGLATFSGAVNLQAALQFAGTAATLGQCVIATGSPVLPTWQSCGYVNPVWYGADPTGVSDSTTAVQNAINAAQTAPGLSVRFPCGTFIVNGVTISQGIEISGCGWMDWAGDFLTNNPPIQGPNGTYIKTTLSSSAAFTIPATGNGVYIHDLAFSQTQPADSGGWTPTVYPPTITFVGDANSQGGSRLSRLLFRGIYIGIAVGSGSGNFGARIFMDNIQGFFFNAGIIINNASDVVHLNDLHIWQGFYADSNNANIAAFVQNNAAGIVTYRDDDPMWENIFINSTFYGILFTSNSAGTTAGAQITNLNCDAVVKCLEFVANQNLALPTTKVSNMIHQCPGSGPYTTGCFAIEVASANNNIISVTNGNFINYQTFATTLTGTGNILMLTNTVVTNCNFSNTSSPATATGAGSTTTLGGAFVTNNGNCTTFAGGAGTINQSHVN